MPWEHPRAEIRHERIGHSKQPRRRPLGVILGILWLSGGRYPYTKSRVVEYSISTTVRAYYVYVDTITHKVLL